jgi:uridine kinase
VVTGPSVADLLVEAALRRPPRLGRTRLVCVDGPAGSGKTTLADALVEAAAHRADQRAGPAAAPTAGAVLLHMDDLYEGWSGLNDEVTDRLDRDVLAPLGEGRAGHYRRYDWHRGRFAEEHEVPVAELLLVEGCGSGAARYADAITLLVWVEAPRELRVRRGVERDGPGVLPHWRAWMTDEERHFARQRTRDRADVRVDGTVDWRDGATALTFTGAGQPSGYEPGEPPAR